jgi:hypothetical protein
MKERRMPVSDDKYDRMLGRAAKRIAELEEMLRVGINVVRRGVPQQAQWSYDAEKLLQSK